MERLSTQSLKVLSSFAKDTQYVEGKLPFINGGEFIPFLVQQGYLSESRLPPEDDYMYPHGVRIYRITSLGVEVLAKAKEETRKQVLSRFAALIKYVAVWLLGVLTPYLAAFIKSLPFIQRCFNLVD